MCKKTSISEIIETVDCDVCLLTETMTTNVKMDGLKCITSKKSIGQNVAIMLRKKLSGLSLIRLYEPNETLNMLGIRIETAKNNFKRIYTAHMKQMSTNSKDVIKNQFLEIVSQFKQAAVCKEGMILICDANVHVGNLEIPGCEDDQDWGGKEFGKMIKDEGLHLLNSKKVCEGTVTRVDPRNGTKSTLDLAICNEFMIDEVQKMVIDEDELFKPTNYNGNKITKTDHNTILIQLKVDKVAVKKEETFINTRSEDGVTVFKEKMESLNFNELFINCENLNSDYRKLVDMWNEALLQSFKKVKVSKNRISGIDREVKELLQVERKIKVEWVNGAEKDKKITEIRKEVSIKIARNLEKAADDKLQKLYQSSCPQAEVFKVRRNTKKSENLDFPLRDANGHIRVTKEGIDEVISNHFKKVFNQNSIEDGWEDYWKVVDNIYECISEREKENIKDGPTLVEISQIIDNLDAKKAVYGDMKIDLIKIAGDNFKALVHRCVSSCFESDELPEEFRLEKMVLLYKNKGKLDNMDNYRGIFLRIIILSIYQKWLYIKCAPIVDRNGSNVAFGGRKGKAAIEPLLIVKLIQDHARWSSEQIILKFLDVEKFFDSMNFKKCLVDLHNSGVDGMFWKAYENINKRKKCIPFIPSGQCSPIIVENVFVQGSTDAVLVAWNHIDKINKKEKDIWSKKCSIQGIDFDALSFVDDIVEILKGQLDLILSSARTEVFEMETRLKFKPSKCKLIVMNMKETIHDDIKEERLEIVEDHEYLGTVVSRDGNRNKEIDSRINGTKSVCNEIVQILKTTELSKVRLRYIKLLSNACIDSKVKYGCAVWNRLNAKQTKEINELKVNMVKRAMEMPYATPTSAVKYEFGLTDIDMEIEMERVLLMNDIMKKENSVAKLLLKRMHGKNIPGFCQDLDHALLMFGLDKDDEIFAKEGKEIRQIVKRKIIKIQAGKLAMKMLEESKTDRMLLHDFCFDGQMKWYLVELSFEEARVIFMIRCRMFPTKDNFKGRWGIECRYCDCMETDMHLFSCAGYTDILEGIEFEMFMSLNSSTEELSKGAKALIKVKERLEMINK